MAVVCFVKNKGFNKLKLMFALLVGKIIPLWQGQKYTTLENLLNTQSSQGNYLQI